VLNPLEAEEQILLDIESCVKEAANDMADADFFSGKRWFDIDVLGAKQSIEIVSTVNSIVAVAKITLPLIIIGAILLLFAILTRM
jgi:predicted neutral ceramidase superfamily lipid hydrolase